MWKCRNITHFAQRKVLPCRWDINSGNTTDAYTSPEITVLACPIIPAKIRTLFLANIIDGLGWYQSSDNNCKGETHCVWGCDMGSNKRGGLVGRRLALVCWIMCSWWIHILGGNWTLTTSCPSFEGLLRFLRGCASFEQIISAMPADYLQPRSIGNWKCLHQSWYLYSKVNFQVPSVVFMTWLQPSNFIMLSKNLSRVCCPWG